MPKNAEPKAPDNWMKEIKEEEAPNPFDLDSMNKNYCLIRCKISDAILYTLKDRESDFCCHYI
jgi:hypothetical protein